MMRWKEKINTTIKTNNATWEDKSECTGERRKTKKIMRKDLTIQTKQDILKQWKKILFASRRRMHEDIPTNE